MPRLAEQQIHKYYLQRVIETCHGVSENHQRRRRYQLPVPTKGSGESAERA